jgi:amphi-Trp domain-containing protein
MSDDPIHRSRRSRSRRAIASYFSRVARALRRGEPVPADEDQTVTVDPAAEPDLEIEIDRGGDTVSLELEMEWEADGDDVVTETNASKATFELYEDSAEEWRWRLRHRNGNIIADGGEGYTEKGNATGGIESVTTNAPGAPVVDESKDEAVADDDGSKATFELFADTAEEWRWRLRHDNGNIIADSGQGYSSKQKAKQGLRSVKRNVPGAAVEEVEG